MEKVTLFYLDGCPYCRNARKAYEELKAECPNYAKIPIDWINETEHPEIIENYDYCYVPCAFLGREKLYEAHPGESFDACKEEMRRVLERAK